MTITEVNSVDLATIDPDSGKFLLTISDHLEWTDDFLHHLVLLQDKINTYLRFIESGEIYEACPMAVGRHVVIRVVGKNQLNEAAEKFYRAAQSVVETAGYELMFVHLPDSLSS